MDIMIKFNRAMRSSKTSVVKLNDGQHKIAKRDFIFFHDGKRIPLTIQINQKEKSSDVEMILWESVSRISGRCFDLKQAQNYIPGFNPEHPLFNSEIDQMIKKADGPTLEDRQRMNKLYADE